ncbi:hypothetical protein [Acidipropionibacterium jensenii]|uniref:hypothetical protein n=1 Tax=Acidipropionibacterium jensenii TaxID=1749 RepID=UPI00214AE9BF|nr:hypothetical protein [Acidipropionibacterium jensenii]
MGLIPDDATVVALGRQAFGLAAQRAREQGRRTVLVPQFSCQTMVTPWQLEGLAVHRVPVAEDLLMDPGMLAAQLATLRSAGESPVVLHCETFGIHAGADLDAVLTAAGRRGGQVVVDRTHSFLQAHRRPGVDRVEPERGWTEVVSIRKLMPLGELAWITGTGDLELAARTPADDRLTAARMRFLAQPGVEAFEAAEDLADDSWTPVPPHPRTLEQAREVDPAALAEQIMETRRAVLAALAELAERWCGDGRIDVLNPHAVCPLVLRWPGAGRAALALHRLGLEEPIHWDEPAHLGTAGWPQNLLCLPAVLSTRQLARLIEVLAR